LDALDLPEDTIDQVIFLAAANGEVGRFTEAEESALDAEVGALVRIEFRVDHPDAPWCDDEMVDVRVGARNAAVMKRHDADLGQRVQAGRDPCFSGALRPGGGAPARAALDGKVSGDSADEPIPQDSPDVLLWCFDAGLIASLSCLVFTPGRAAGRAAIEVWQAA
jgi:hypothetical protein